MTACVPTTGTAGTGNQVGVSRNEVVVTATGGPVPSVAATPELGTLVLFGAGLAGAAGHVSQRARAARRP